MGELAVPMILERTESQSGHWFNALSDITGANPVSLEDRGDIAAMREAWQEWGKSNGYA